MLKEDSEISEAYSPINEGEPGNPETNKVKFRTARRRKPSRRNSRSKNNKFDSKIDFDNLGEDFLDNMLGNQQGILSSMNMLSQKRRKLFLRYSFLS